MYAYGTVRTYLEAAASGNPTPGGGSVSALAGALGAAMACMAANFTVGRKKFAAVEAEARAHLDACLAARDKLFVLMDEDTLAYGSVSAAYALPKATPEEKSARSAAIQKALLKAMDVPMRTLRVCREAMQSIHALAGIANPGLISDVGVAAILCDAALRAARLNVEVNLKELRDEATVSAARTEIAEAAAESAALAKAALEKVTASIGGSL